MSNHVENKKDVNLIVAYKLGDRYNGEILARSVLYAHYFHAINNGDKVLFTVKTENVTKVGKKKQLGQLIMTLGDFSDCFIADINDFDEFQNNMPNSSYQNSSQFNTNQEIIANHTWFELSDLKWLTTSNLAQFKNVNTGKDLTESLSGQSCRIYVL
ncbi:hypothetical protein JZY07_10140 [Streptococcus suis]|uniref:Uncharacterized protein n=1 Tax=Streptococcus suis TaxID=1307 RepID=A0A540UW90_STRSU|nr:hypothetical protein [Streptococcus suis]MBO4130266.1 hypothetical protein [Streptococcus suis]MBO4133470.1 hypothetical protein [Streptococcus suis]MCK3847786.1 hypothetical protein [Streptococcus suis]MCK3907564.1 hypothetical protein [Streptococcus suis]MCK3958191.1 hypothetical protein [Streptococcus suis]